MSYLFNGAGDRIQLANVPANAPTQLTIIAWVKANAFTARDTVLAHYHNATDAYYGLFLAPLGSPGGGTVSLRVPFTTQPGRWNGPADLLTAPTGWVGIAVTYDGSSASNDPNFYLKPEGGSLSRPAVTEASTPIGTFDGTLNEMWVGGVDFAYFLTGRLAYVREFTSVLSAAEVEAEMDAMAAVLAAEIDLPLVADANDDSGNGHNGTVTGATLDGDNPNLGGGGGIPPLNAAIYQRRMRRFFSGI